MAGADAASAMVYSGADVGLLFLSTKKLARLVDEAIVANANVYNTCNAPEQREEYQTGA